MLEARCRVFSYQLTILVKTSAEIFSSTETNPAVGGGEFHNNKFEGKLGTCGNIFLLLPLQPITLFFSSHRSSFNIYFILWSSTLIKWYAFSLCILHQSFIHYRTRKHHEFQLSVSAQQSSKFLSFHFILYV